MQTNVNDKFKDMRAERRLARLWSRRGFSLYAKITIIRPFLLPKMFYLFSVLHVYSRGI